jgi:4-hydroxy-tetrahydrodipicolinate synthase
LAVTPPYNKPSLQGLIGHYSAITEAQNKPVCLYHVPGRTGQKLSADELVELAKIKGLDFIKEASGDLALFSKVHQKSSFDTILSGDDLTFLPSLSLGGHGAVSVVSNIFPAEYKMIQTQFNIGNFDKALEIHETMSDFTDALFCEPNPCPTKAVLNHLNLCQNTFRLPLAPVTEENSLKIIRIYQSCSQKLKAITLDSAN